MLSALVGALLSEVAYRPGTHWVEERTAKTSRSGSALPARVGAESGGAKVMPSRAHAPTQYQLFN